VKRYTIFDLDNCIADDEWRIAHIRWQKSDLNARYHEYHVLAAWDGLCNREALRAASEYGGIIIFTARPVMYRAITEQWLARNEVPYDILIMRNNDDHRPSVELKRSMLRSLPELYDVPLHRVIMAYDDRMDVVDMYREHAVVAQPLAIHNVCAYTPPERPQDTLQFKALGRYDIAQPQPPAAAQPQTAADILEAMAATFRERNAVYGDNYRMVGQLMRVLFPTGAPAELLHSDQFHLFELILVKLSRYAISALQHTDSIHDAGVYCAMCEAINSNRKQEPQQ
jgi:hypothetical protein